MNDLTFEQAMGRIDEIIAQLESGNVPLGDTLQLYGEGAELLARCDALLDEARLRVETLDAEE